MLVRIVGVWSTRVLGYIVLIVGGLLAPLFIKPEYLREIWRQYGLAAAVRAWIGYVVLFTPMLFAAVWLARTLQLLP